MCFIRHEARIHPSREEAERVCKSSILVLLSQEDNATDWDVIDGLLQQLQATRCLKTARCSAENDSMGRLLLGSLLSKNPPSASVMYALQAFPDALHHNPAAFFTACRDASPETLGVMMRHSTQASKSNKECPYPWIISGHVSLEGAQAILDAHPEGVLKPCQSLSGLCLVDYFLMSSDMIEHRSFDIIMWNKFKLVLLAAAFCYNQKRSDQLSPIHVILKRILSSRDFLTNTNQAQHVLWLLHHLCWTDQWVFERQDIDGSYPLHLVLNHPCTVQGSCLPVARELVKILLQAHPDSARHTMHGRLPLHMAVENGWPCHDLLLAVFPEALDILDPKTELFPFQTAARAKEQACALDVTYELLRANPTLSRALEITRVS